MRKLHPRGLGQGQMQFLLKVLVHRVNQAIADSPEEKQRADENEREHQVLPVVRDKKALLFVAHNKIEGAQGIFAMREDKAQFWPRGGKLSRHFEQLVCEIP